MIVAIIIALILMLLIWSFFWNYVIASTLIIGGAILLGFFFRRILSDLIFGPSK